MIPDEPYHGWSNSATFEVQLYLGAELDAVAIKRELSRTNRTPESLAIALEEWMGKIVYRDWSDTFIKDPVENPRRNLTGGALARVDWLEIAKTIRAIYPD